VQELLGIVRAIHAQGTSIVLVEQSLNIACEVCDCVSFLEKGQVRFEGPTRQLLERETSPAPSSSARRIGAVA
jgi:ABC-type branched-subunit amino acid transport system ATPase component